MNQGQIIEKGPNKWLVRWYIGRSEAGRRRYASETVRGSKRDAERNLREKLKAKDDGLAYEPTRITVDKHLDDWLVQLDGKRAAKTVDSYGELLRLYVRPYVGHVRLDKLRLGHIDDDVVATLQASGKSPRTIRLAVTILGAACKWGMKRGRLLRNPCEGVDFPETGKKEDVLALSPEQVRAFREAAAGDRHEVLFDFLLFTGCRPGEAQALRWKDLDLEEAVAHVRRALSRSSKGYEFRNPKAGSGRKVPLPETLVRRLREHRKAQAEHKLGELAPYYNRELDLVFATDLGEPLDLRNLVQRHFKPTVKAAGLPQRLRLYDLRHTHASNLLAAGEPVKAVSERLGHASAKMTLDVYAHVLPGQGERLAGVAEELFGG
jgi:integrase